MEEEYGSYAAAAASAAAAARLVAAADEFGEDGAFGVLLATPLPTAALAVVATCRRECVGAGVMIAQLDRSKPQEETCRIGTRPQRRITEVCVMSVCAWWTVGGVSALLSPPFVPLIAACLLLYDVLYVAASVGIACVSLAVSLYTSLPHTHTHTHTCDGTPLAEGREGEWRGPLSPSPCVRACVPVHLENDTLWEDQ